MIERAEIKAIESGSVVIINLHQPREKMLGLLIKLDGIGAQLRGIDLNSFDNLIQQVRAGEGGTGFGPVLSTMFFPSPRIERILLDEPAGQLPSCGDRFKENTGINLKDFLRCK